MDRIMGVRFDGLIKLDTVYADSYGFRSELSTEQFFGRMFGVVEAKQRLRKYVSLTQLDVKSAYTMVPHVRLILALDDFIKRTENPKSHQYLIHFTVKWLENRTVKFDKTWFKMKCGLVQGSPVSPALFVIFLHYISDSENSVILKFADDVSLLSWAATPELLKKEVKLEVEKFEKWLAEREMIFQPSKSKFILFNRTLKTAQKQFSDLGIEITDGLRVLGVWITSKLCFHQHVDKVLNKLRKRVNALRLFKKIGLSVNHSLQFSLCAANTATYGLYWHAFLSQTDRNRLETMWSKFLKISTHENCPKSVKPSKIREILGIRDFQSFSTYLIHLRTSSHHQNPRCERFTLSPTELLEFRSTEVVRSTSTARKTTTNKTAISLEAARKTERGRKLGTVKAYTCKLADQHAWTVDSFSRSKEELRVKYSIDRKKCSQEIYWPKPLLHKYLLTFVHSEVKNYYL